MPSPTDAAVALLPCPFCGAAPRIDEGMRGYPCVLCGQCGASSDYASTDDESEAITAWNTRAQAPAAGVTDAQRLDWLEKAFTGMTNGERYLPRVMGWGPSRNGRTMREAIDKYMTEDAAMTGGLAGGGGS